MVTGVIVSSRELVALRLDKKVLRRLIHPADVAVGGQHMQPRHCPRWGCASACPTPPYSLCSCAHAPWHAPSHVQVLKQHFQQRDMERGLRLQANSAAVTSVMDEGLRMRPSKTMADDAEASLSLRLSHKWVHGVCRPRL